MIKHFCDKCKKEIDADTCEEVIFDEKGPMELCDDCYESFTFLFDAWINGKEGEKLYEYKNLSKYRI